jgi:hypothetical protein
VIRPDNQPNDRSSGHTLSSAVSRPTPTCIAQQKEGGTEPPTFIRAFRSTPEDGGCSRGNAIPGRLALL